MAALSVRIRRARTQSGLTQAALAQRLCVQRSAVTQWERDPGTTPSVGHLAQIAQETGVHFEWLATGRGPSHPDAEAFVVAVVEQDFARDEFESRVLMAARRVPRRRREAVAQVIELLSN